MSDETQFSTWNGPNKFYESMSRAEAWVRTGLPGIDEMPESIADLRFETAFSYTGGQITEARFYVIWTGPDSREVQLVVSPGSLPPDTPTIEEFGGGAMSLNVQEESTHWQIFASDSGLLRDAVLALRPDYEGKLK